jgi:hypothetical protein
VSAAIVQGPQSLGLVVVVSTGLASEAIHDESLGNRGAMAGGGYLAAAC